MKIMAVTQHAPGKTANEDRVIAGRSILADGTMETVMQNGFAGIADGVGGNNAGAVASHFAAINLSGIDRISQEVLGAVNEALLNLSGQQPAWEGMATTLSGIGMHDGCAELFSTGNTRVYSLVGGAYLKQLSTDDTTVHFLVETGQISEEEAQKSERRSEITACYGGGNARFLQIEHTVLGELAEPFLVTSDGVHDFVSTDQMEDLLQENGLTLRAARKLVEAARKNGSEDDASVLLADPRTDICVFFPEG